MPFPALAFQASLGCTGFSSEINLCPSRRMSRLPKQAKAKACRLLKRCFSCFLACRSEFRLRKRVHHSRCTVQYIASHKDPLVAAAETDRQGGLQAQHRKMRITLGYLGCLGTQIAQSLCGRKNSVKCASQVSPRGTLAAASTCTVPIWPCDCAFPRPPHESKAGLSLRESARVRRMLAVFPRWGLIPTLLQPIKPNNSLPPQCAQCASRSSFEGLTQRLGVFLDQHLDGRSTANVQHYCNVRHSRPGFEPGRSPQASLTAVTAESKHWPTPSYSSCQTTRRLELLGCTSASPVWGQKVLVFDCCGYASDKQIGCQSPATSETATHSLVSGTDSGRSSHPFVHISSPSQVAERVRADETGSSLQPELLVSMPIIATYVL